MATGLHFMVAFPLDSSGPTLFPRILVFAINPSLRLRASALGPLHSPVGPSTIWELIHDRLFQAATVGAG
jgi:hypothetical protein